MKTRKNYWVFAVVIVFTVAIQLGLVYFYHSEFLDNNTQNLIETTNRLKEAGLTPEQAYEISRAFSQSHREMSNLFFPVLMFILILNISVTMWTTRLVIEDYKRKEKI